MYVRNVKFTLPLGFSFVAGYMKIPPYLIVLWTSATIEPTYRAPYGFPVAGFFLESTYSFMALSQDLSLPSFMLKYVGLIWIKYIIKLPAVIQFIHRTRKKFFFNGQIDGKKRDKMYEMVKHPLGVIYLYVFPVFGTLMFLSVRMNSPMAGS